MRKSARHIPQCPPHIAPAGRNGTTADKPIGYGRPPSRRNGVFLPFRHSSSHVGIHRSDGTAYRKGRTDRHRKTTCESPAVAVGTIYAVIADAVRPLPKRRPNSLSPHDRNVQERPRPDRRTETSAPRSERPCDLGSEKPAQSPCENSLRLFPNRSRFSHLPGLNPFRRTSDFSAARRRRIRTDDPHRHDGNLTDGPSERYDPVP